MTPELTRQILWWVFVGLVAYDVLAYSINPQATISVVLHNWSRERPEIMALLALLYAHAFLTLK